MSSEEEIKDFKVIIAGGRDFGDTELLEKTCDSLLKKMFKVRNVQVVCGMARGADLLGKRYAQSRRLDLAKFPADWDRYPKWAGHRRNAQMARYADALIVFWDGKSRGTENMIKNAKKFKLKYIEIVRY
jgi:hypothetical protein